MYDFAHARAYIPVECAFGALKGRFQILWRELESHSEQINATVIRACRGLHNICIMHDNDTLEALSRIVVDEDRNYTEDELLRHDNDTEIFDSYWDTGGNELRKGETKRSFYLRLICSTK